MWKLPSPQTTSAILLAAALTACTWPAELVGVETRLRAAPEEVELGVIWLGHPEPVRVRLLNDSRIEAAFIAVIESRQLEAEPRGGSVPAGDGLDVELMLMPTATGKLEDASLHFNSGEVVVALKGDVRAPPPCDFRQPCGVQRFAADQDGCEWVPLDDGVECQGPCVVDGVCQAGLCMGQVRTCPDDDGDACTVAACHHETGCTLVPRICRPTSSCATATCDSSTGCVEEPVQDGTYCGEANCDQDHVCIAGACVARPPPDDRKVQHCLRAKAVHVMSYYRNPGRPMSCAVTTEEEAVCWGNVRPSFRTDNFGLLAAGRIDDEGPWVARLGPARAIYPGGHPFLLQRPDGQTSYLAVDEGMDDVLQHWGAAGRGLHPLPALADMTGAIHYQNGMCAVTKDGDLLCGGADHQDPGFVLSPATPTVAGGVVAASGSIGIPCVRMASGAIRCRGTVPWYASFGLAVGTKAFSQVQGLPPFTDFDAFPRGGWRACGVTPWGEVYCATCGPFTAVAGLPRAHRVQVNDYAACALVEGGDVWCWGRILPQQEWNPPRRVEGLERIVDFDLGEPMASSSYRPTLCALGDEGRVKCMGGNWFRQAGVFEAEDGGYRPSHVLEPTAVVLPDAGVDVTF
jgi:hypothetical protein